MLASREAQSASADVKSDHRFPASTLIEQQHLTNDSPRRSSYSLYRPNNHEPDIYPEFNWESHSNVKLSDPVNPPPHQLGNMKKQTSSPGTSGTFEVHCGVASPSPSLSLSDTGNSDGVNGSNDMRSMSLTTSVDPHIKEKESLQPSNKRQRPPSLSQLDYRSFDRSPYARRGAPINASPDSFGVAGGQLGSENVNSGSLPPNVNSQDSENNGTSNNANDPLQLSPHFHYQSSESVAGNTDTSGSPSGQRSVHEKSISLQSSSDLSSFVGEYAVHQNSVHNTLRLPHPATSASFSHQPESQSLPFPSHSHGYLSALPSPVVTQFDEQTQSSHRPSYLASLMTLSAPNSATFPPAHNSSFSPLSPQLNSTPNRRHLVSPSPPPFHSSATQFSRTSHLPTPYRNDGAAERVAPPVSTSAPPPASCTKAPSPSNTPSLSIWNPVENQAPRRRGKLPSTVTGILKAWLMSHTAHPYPTEEEKKSLCERTNLSMSQVSNWFINARRRILVPPSAGNSVHEVRQPLRRQAQSQLARAASNASLAPPCLTIRDHSPQSLPSTPSPGVTLFSPVSTSSPHLSSGGAFDFHYPLPHQTTHESPYHGGSLIGCRTVSSACSSPPPWHHTTPLSRQQPSSPIYPPHASHAVSYYSSSQSAYPPYHVNHSSVSSTTLQSPMYSYPDCQAPFPTNVARLNSPRSHPPTPTLPHSCDSRHPSSETYIAQPPCNKSHPTTPDREN